MANKLLRLPGNRLFNNSNIASPGGTATLYLSGTVTLANFLDSSGVPLGPTITANGIGQLPDAYGDEAVAYRVILRDSAGVQLDGGDIDPFYFGSAGSSVSTGALLAANNLSDVANAVTARTNLGLGTIAVEDEATAAQIRSGTASKAVAADKLLAAMAIQTLTDGATVSWDLSTAINAKVTLGGNRTLAVSNPVQGATYSLGVAQDATGSRTVTWPASFDWGTTGAPTLTTTASKRDRVTIFCTDAATPKFDAFLSGKGFA